MLEYKLSARVLNEIKLNLDGEITESYLYEPDPEVVQVGWELNQLRIKRRIYDYVAAALGYQQVPDKVWTSLMCAEKQTQKILALLTQIYGSETAEQTHGRLLHLIESYRSKLSASDSQPLSHKDAILITYGDMVQSEGVPHLTTLNRFLADTVADTISTVHILPFYPWSSDDGFSVIDYLAIDPPLGSWENVTELGQNFRLMFDAVINHISQESDWFQRFLAGEAPYTNYFKTVDPQVDLSAVFRPRTHPLLTPFQTAAGEKHVWTTFSADQIDLNYESPRSIARDHGRPLQLHRLRCQANPPRRHRIYVESSRNP